MSDQVTVRFEELNAAQSELDKALSRAYHELERISVDFSPDEGYEHSKRIKTILHRRRAVKDELVRIQPMYDLLNKNVGKVEADYVRRVEKGDAMKKSLGCPITVEEAMREWID
ncbi:hypothetical protein J0K78_17060 [Halobacillus sp. GSS1]|uniref:hypothetical protein n=1 Tax=Halobacillus sp. GSS1 TaxID=2815919 RepID=UPI001A8CDFD6|nr:hypothetical protein [Halobacillus sp. GSS1]MBN9655988.1 hypothetical protein [Halobacillus sp. GSS1]